MSLYAFALLHILCFLVRACIVRTRPHPPVCVVGLPGRFFNSQSLAPGLQGSMGDCEGLRGISVDQNRSAGIIWDHRPSL